jgi:disulfide oxidoreductase YuzD
MNNQNQIRNNPYVTTIGSNNYAYPNIITNGNLQVNGSIISYYDTTETGQFLTVFTEKEIDHLINVYQSRITLSSEKNRISDILKSVVSRKHFSEKFLLKYFSYLDKDVIMIMHKSDIISGSYAALKLQLNI